MGAFADFAAYQAAVRSPLVVLPFLKGSQVKDPFRIGSLWTVAAFAGSAPTTATACDRSTTGALVQLYSTTKQLYLVQAEAVNSNGGNCSLSMILIDRLSHQGGLVGNTSSEQTTNLPTAALSRYTSGAGVQVALEIYTAIGSTATSVTLKYTNSSGTANRVTQPVEFGATNDNRAGNFYPISLQDGDEGVRSVESVTLAGSTGTAGAFGVVLYRPLALIPGGTVNGPLPGQVRPVLGGIPSGMPEIDDSACLALLCCAGLATTVGFLGQLHLGAA